MKKISARFMEILAISLIILAILTLVEALQKKYNSCRYGECDQIVCVDEGSGFVYLKTDVGAFQIFSSETGKPAICSDFN